MQLLNRSRSIVQLDNGLEFQGYSFGYMAPADGEVVFSTTMTGYPESLTDPSYEGQILCSTYPLIGNYGVPKAITVGGVQQYFESERIHVRGLIISDYSLKYSHWSEMCIRDSTIHYTLHTTYYILHTTNKYFQHLSFQFAPTGHYGGCE